MNKLLPLLAIFNTSTYGSSHLPSTNHQCSGAMQENEHSSTEINTQYLAHAKESDQACAAFLKAYEDTSHNSDAFMQKLICDINTYAHLIKFDLEKIFRLHEIFFDYEESEILLDDAPDKATAETIVDKFETLVASSYPKCQVNYSNFQVSRWPVLEYDGSPNLRTFHIDPLQNRNVLFFGTLDQSNIPVQKHQQWVTCEGQRVETIEIDSMESNTIRVKDENGVTFTINESELSHPADYSPLTTKLVPGLSAKVDKFSRFAQSYSATSSNENYLLNSFAISAETGIGFPTNQLVHSQPFKEDPSETTRWVFIGEFQIRSKDDPRMLCEYI